MCFDCVFCYLYKTVPIFVGALVLTGNFDVWNGLEKETTAGAIEKGDVT